jgi:ArsR family transcriptional regulator, arsenate/arsenite/antimonite-responsive transcriptional repressor
METQRSARLVAVMAENKAARIAQPLTVIQPRAPLAEPRVVAEPRNLTVEAFRALADPVRLELLARVAAYGPVCVCHLEEQLPYSQSRISKHLGTLRRAGLVSSRREGTWVYYETSDEMLAAAREFLDQLGASLHTPHEADLCEDS